MKLQAIFRSQATLAMIVATAAIAIAACGGGGSSVGGGGLRCTQQYGGGGGSSSGSCPTPTPVPVASAAAVGLVLSGENEVTVATYGLVLGYHNGLAASSAPTDSGVVNLAAATNVQFTNTETSASGIPHTASSLGGFTAPFPGFPSAGPPAAALTASAAGSSIGTAGFSTGNLNPGQASAVYTTGGPAMYIFGCYYHYNDPFDATKHMRTIVIVT